MMRVRGIVTCIAVLLTAGPLALAVTLALIPAWRGLEAHYGIEAYGHSGPSGWCYVVSYLTSVVLLAWIVRLRRGRARS